MPGRNNNPEPAKPLIRDRLLPFLIGVLLCTLTFVLRNTLRVKERSDLQNKVRIETENLASHIDADLRNRIPSLQRLVKEWEEERGESEEEFISRTASYMSDIPGFQAIEWVDRNGYAKWVIPLEGNEKAVNLFLPFEGNRRSAMEKSMNLRSPSISLPIDLVQGGKGFLAFFPIYIYNRFDGYIVAVFRIQEWLDFVFSLRGEKQLYNNYRISVDFDNTAVYRQEGWDSLEKYDFNITASARILDHSFNVHIRPTQNFIKENRTLLPDITAVFGVMMSVLVSIVALLFQKENLQARRANAAREALEAEVEERRSIEEELHRTLVRIELATSAAMMGIWTWNISTGRLTWNEQMYELFGIPSDISPTYDTWRSAVHPDDVDTAEELLKKSVQGKAIFNTEFRIVIPSGAIRHIRAASKVIRDQDGKPAYVTGLSWDVSESREVETALKQSEEHVLLLLNSTGEAIYGIDMKGNCTFANPACARILGYADAGVFLGRNMHNLIHHSYNDGKPMPVENCRIYLAYREGRNMHVDDEVLWRADGTSFPAEYWSYPQVAGGEIVGAVVTFIDITERKLAEQNLIKTKEQAEEASRAKSEFLANISHDLRTPMNAIIGISGLLVKKYGEKGDRFEEGLNLIHESGNRLLGLINDLLDLSRIEARGMELFNSCFQVKALTEGLEGMVEALVRGKDIKFTIDCDAPDREIYYDRDKLYRIIMNLLGNSAKFTEAGEIILRIRISSNKSMFEVKDTGIGIDAAALQHVFEPFYQADYSITKLYPGSGLGLTLCKSMAEIMGGILEIESRKGEGTSVRLYLPPSPENENHCS